MLKTSPKSHQKISREMQESGSLGSFDGIFTTYSQLQTVKGKETSRRAFLRQFAPGSVLVLDESHEAGGEASGGRKVSAAANRADFVRELVDLSDGVLYSSATYAKRPDVMDLYKRTNMQLALSSMGALADLVQQGGVPMQQALATMLADDGQYLRRERSFEGVSFTPEVVPVNREKAETIALIMRRIMAFDQHKQRAVKSMDKDFKAQAKALLGDSAIGQAGATSTNFTSVMHNLIGQMLLSLKAEATVQKALESLGRDEKPVIALSNTMGSFLGQYAEMHGLQPGEIIDADFSDLLARYLERSREVIVGHPYGAKERHRLTDAELGAEAASEYDAILKLIAETDLSGIPISPIDRLAQQLTEKGYRVREITGREHAVNYNPDGTAVYQRRSSAERSKTAAVKNVDAFNQGEADVIILNRSGSTGISLHASEKFADQRRRHMLVIQPELDINLFMQTLGRVHRTGQVVSPAFSLLMADIPAEKRPGAVLAKKMASLNANTTAARNSGVSMAEISDFFNEYGDRVVAELMMAYPTVHKQLDYPLKGTVDELEAHDAVRKVTGRLPLLPLAEQERLYELIEREYRDLVAHQEALGESTLEAQSLDLDARVLARMEVAPADPNSTSPFTSAVYLEVVDAKTQRKPYTTREVVNILRENLDLPSLKRLPKEYEFGELVALGRERTQALLSELDERVGGYKAHVRATVEPVLQERILRNLDYQLPRIKQALEEFPLGTAVRLQTASSDRELSGVVSRLWRTGDEKGNPVAPSSWKMQILLADSAREITVPLSRLNGMGENSITVTPAEEIDEIYKRFDKQRTRAREQRQIFTGNLLRAFERFPTAQVLNYTDSSGQIRTGLLTKQDFDIEKVLEKQPVRMRSVEEAVAVLERGLGGGRLQTMDRLLTIQSRDGGEEYVLQTPKARAVGGRYFLDSNLLAAMGGEFVSVADRMECTIPAERLEPVLKTIVDEKRWTLAAFEEQAQVRSQLGIELPALEKVEAQTSPTELVQQHLDRVSPTAGDYHADEGQRPVNASLDQLREWYRAARDMNLDREKLERIHELGRSAKATLEKGEELYLAAESVAAMKQDLERYQPFQERGRAVADAASAVLQHIGQQTRDGVRYLKGKTYEMIQTPNSLTVLRADEGKPTKILEVKEGKLERTQVTAEDCQKFLHGLEQLKALNVEKAQQPQR